MNPKDYIKVTPKGVKQSVIIPASNRDFYLSVGAKVEKPTEEEIYEACPYLREDTATTPPNAQAALEQAIEELNAENKSLREEKASLLEQIDRLEKQAETKKTKK